MPLFQLFFLAFAVVLFAVSAYQSTDVSQKLQSAGLAFLALAFLAVAAR